MLIHMDELRNEHLAFDFVHRNSVEGNSEMGSPSFQILYQRQNSFFLGTDPLRTLFSIVVDSIHNIKIILNSYLPSGVLFNPGIQRMNDETNVNV